jgi:hypothetical protein
MFCIVDSATQRLPLGGFRHAAMKIAAGAPIGIRSQANRTTAKLAYLKFMNEKKIKIKNKHAPCRVAMCDQCNEIIKRAFNLLRLSI